MRIKPNSKNIYGILRLIQDNRLEEIHISNHMIKEPNLRYKYLRILSCFEIELHTERSLKIQIYRLTEGL